MSSRKNWGIMDGEQPWWTGDKRTGHNLAQKPPVPRAAAPGVWRAGEGGDFCLSGKFFALSEAVSASLQLDGGAMGQISVLTAVSIQQTICCNADGLLKKGFLPHAVLCGGVFY